MGIGLEDLVAEQTVVGIVLAEVDKRFVDDEADASVLAPLCQAQDVVLGDEVARGVVGVDKQQARDAPACEVVNKVVGCIFQVRVIRLVRHDILLTKAVRIFFKRGIDDAYPACRQFHQALDQLSGSIAHHHVVLSDAEVLARQQRIDQHARGIFRQQRVEVVAQLVFHALGGEVGIHQVAVVQHLGEAPVAAIAVIETPQHLVILGEDGLGNVQVLNVVYLVPLLAAYGHSLQLGIVEQGDDAQHLFVIFVVA